MPGMQSSFDWLWVHAVCAQARTHARVHARTRMRARTLGWVGGWVPGRRLGVGGC